MALPVPQPAYILRGHASQIHATTFIRENSRLVTGDAEGWVVVWGLVLKRAVAVWKAHEGSLLGVRAWGSDRLITWVRILYASGMSKAVLGYLNTKQQALIWCRHGKDNKLVVWKFSQEDEGALSTTLPVDNSTEQRQQPWVMHVLQVNTMNFCSFAQCPASSNEPSKDELLIAVPNTLSSESVSSNSRTIDHNWYFPGWHFSTAHRAQDTHCPQFFVL